MHAEYCFVPAALTRLPCGITHVVGRATSVIVGACTIDTLDGTGSPCRLKLTTKRNCPSGVRPIVAGNSPRFTRPTSESPSVVNFHTLPNGVPCASETYQYRPSGETVMPCGPSTSAGIDPFYRHRAVHREALPGSERQPAHQVG